jgi:hypothetical protein
LTQALVQVVLPLLPPGPIWEPAAGDGVLVDALTAAGREVIASDIQRQRTSFLELDFLTGTPPPITSGALLITNPPFNRNGEFLRRAIDLLDDGHLAAAVLLQRADAGGTDGRSTALNYAAREFTCCWRPTWIPGSRGGARWWFEWIVWLAGCSGPPVHYRIRRRDLRPPLK